MLCSLHCVQRCVYLKRHKTTEKRGGKRSSFLICKWPHVSFVIPLTIFRLFEPFDISPSKLSFSVSVHFKGTLANPCHELPFNSQTIAVTVAGALTQRKDSNTGISGQSSLWALKCLSLENLLDCIQTLQKDIVFHSSFHFQHPEKFLSPSKNSICACELKEEMNG